MASNKTTGAAPVNEAAADPVTDAVADVVIKEADVAAPEEQKKPSAIEWPGGLNDDAVLPLEELREKLEVKASLFAGVCTANRWRPGKMVSVKEFKAAAEKFAGGAMGRNEKRCSET